MQKLGLVQHSVDDLAVDVNFLYAMALDKVVFLPFAYVIDKWRYSIFRGEITKDEYNCHYWRLRYEIERFSLLVVKLRLTSFSEQYTGVKPPVLRSEMDFDPGAKYHIPANIPYLR